MTDHSRTLQIEDFAISDASDCYVIAEIGHNHQGSLEQAKRMFDVGQRIPTGYSYYTPYDRIPAGYRDQYGLASDSRYIYRDNSIYVVDPATSLVTRIIDLIR